jgi:hypothetical protein
MVINNYLYPHSIVNNSCTKNNFSTIATEKNGKIKILKIHVYISSKTLDFPVNNQKPEEILENKLLSKDDGKISRIVEINQINLLEPSTSYNSENEIQKKKFNEKVPMEAGI